jgi:hypothetical protein
MSAFWEHLGLKKETPLNESELRLLAQLQDNRQMALQKIPADMKNEFISSVYPDKQLKSFVRAVGNNHISEELRSSFLEDAIRLSISIKRFGIRLIINHRMDPQVIAKIMMDNIIF